jgi:hypothetical protein
VCCFELQLLAAVGVLGKGTGEVQKNNTYFGIVKSVSDLAWISKIQTSGSAHLLVLFYEYSQ